MDPRGASRSTQPATGPLNRRGEENTGRAGGLHWSAILAGTLAALTVFLLLELLVFGLGISEAADRPGEVGSEDWIAWIIGLIAFFVGGYVGAGIAATRDNRAGLIDGLLVWALGSVLILTLCALGIGQLFGALGDVVGQSLALGNPSTAIEPSRLTSTIQSSALGAFFSLLLWAIAAGVGGWIGSRSRLLL
jgi:hypothetical protein